MSEKVLVPVLGESINEATVAKWLKKEGESVEIDEPIVELETDKVNLEVPSPTDGILTQITAKDGETVEVGATLGSIVKESLQNINKEIKTPKENIIKVEKQNEENLKFFNHDNNELKKDIVLKKKSETPLVLTEEIDQPSIDYKVDVEETENKNNQTLSPAVRKIVQENKIDTTNIKGTGKDGRIVKSDLINLMETKPEPSERKVKFGHEERIKMTRLRITIAKRLKQAQETAAMLTTFNEIDMTKIIEMRKENQEDFQSRFGVKLGFMSFFVKASVVGLKSYPAINAEIDNDEIVYKNYYNISFAVSTDKGLVVPVLKNSDELSFADIEKNIKTISEKAKSGKLSIEDLQGGTFTISNGGVYGSMLSTPILNSPQSGVLGMHNIVERPIVINGEIKIRPIMYLALSYDHRIIDGKEAVSFLKSIKENLEDPRRLFLDL